MNPVAKADEVLAKMAAAQAMLAGILEGLRARNVAGRIPDPRQRGAVLGAFHDLEALVARLPEMITAVRAVKARLPAATAGADSGATLDPAVLGDLEFLSRDVQRRVGQFEALAAAFGIPVRRHGVGRGKHRRN